MKQRHSGRNKTKQKQNTNLKQISFMRSVNSTSQVFVHKEFSLCLCLCPAPLSLVSFYLLQKKFDIAELLMSLYWCVENVVLLLSTSKACETLVRGSTRDQQVRGSPQCSFVWAFLCRLLQRSIALSSSPKLFFPNVLVLRVLSRVFPECTCTEGPV